MENPVGADRHAEPDCCARCLCFRIDECHRQPPLVFMIASQGAFIGVWPKVKREHWCGEFRPMPAAPIGGDSARDNSHLPDPVQ